MNEINYMIKKDTIFYRWKCARMIKKIMEDYIDVELRIKRSNSNAREELIKKKGEEFSIREYMNLDLLEGEKMNLQVFGDMEKLRGLLVKICMGLSCIKR